MQVTAKECRAQRLTKLDQSSVRGVLQIGAGETAQDVRRSWGEGTTACAADSKQFGAWDQNLMTEWHVRYGGRGVMIYWHVERHRRRVALTTWAIASRMLSRVM